MKLVREKSERSPRLHTSRVDREITETTGRDSSGTIAKAGTEGHAAASAGRECNRVKSTHDVYENAWKSVVSLMYFFHMCRGT